MEEKQMQYLEIKPDYVESGIKSEFDGYLDIDELPFDENLKLKIKSLNDRYKKIIPMGEKMRQAHMDLIYQLDTEGYLLKTEIEGKYNIKVKYFSEGCLKYLFESPNKVNYQTKRGFYSTILRALENVLGNKTKT